MTLVFLEIKHKWLYSSVVERWTCNQKIAGLHPGWRSQLKSVYQYCFQATSTCFIHVLVGLIFFCNLWQSRSSQTLNPFSPLG